MASILIHTHLQGTWHDQFCRFGYGEGGNLEYHYFWTRGYGISETTTDTIPEGYHYVLGPLLNYVTTGWHPDLPPPGPAYLGMEWIQTRTVDYDSLYSNDEGSGGSGEEGGRTPQASNPEPYHKQQNVEYTRNFLTWAFP